MKITELETIPLRLPFAQPFKISQGADRESIETLIVRVHTDEGIVGIGETQAWRRQGSAELIWNLVRTVKDEFEPRLAGRSLEAKRALYQAIVRRLEALGTPPKDVFVVLHEPPMQNWGIRGGLPASEVDLGFEVKV